MFYSFLIFLFKLYSYLTFYIISFFFKKTFVKLEKRHYLFLNKTHRNVLEVVTCRNLNLTNYPTKKQKILLFLKTRANVYQDLIIPWTTENLTLKILIQESWKGDRITEREGARSVFRVFMCILWEMLRWASMDNCPAKNLTLPPLLHKFFRKIKTVVWISICFKLKML